MNMLVQIKNPDVNVYRDSTQSQVIGHTYAGYKVAVSKVSEDKQFYYSEAYEGWIAASNFRILFEDFRNLQERTRKHIQITEFDMSLGRTQIPRVFGNNPEVTLEQVYEYKHQKIGEISSIISESGVHLDGISYWSLTDGIDCNLERVRSNYLADGSITDIHQIPSACGGLFPTHKKLIKKQEFS